MPYSRPIVIVEPPVVAPTTPDLTGQKFGRLRASRLIGRDRWKRNCWDCRCDCGGRKVVAVSDLKGGGVRSCGCLHKEWDVSRGLRCRLDLIGRRFGRWKVVADAGVDRRRKTRWKCRCDCGTVRIVSGDHLNGGRSTNCGCQRRATLVGMLTTHGLSGTREFGIWQAMHNRCYWPRHVAFKHYGGRGIKVCRRWNRFENFYSDMGPRPSPKHSIDRIDNDGNYTPRNCRWATPKEQANNKRRRITA